MEIFFTLGILFFIGIALLAGLIGGKSFRKIHFPQVVGYIVFGAVIGLSGFNLINEDVFAQMGPVNSFALGLIGFMIGRELNFSVFKQLGKSIFTILCFEVVGTFIIVTIAIWFLAQKLYVALIFGALATATAPAATVEVLWELKARGVLTTTIFTLVALDDVLALLVFAFAVSYARALITHTGFTVMSIILLPLLEIISSIFLGFLMGFSLVQVAERVKNEKRFLPLILATLMICISVAERFQLSPILSCMILGMTLVNMKLSRKNYVFKVIEDFSEPIYILFFVLVGSQLQIAELPKLGLIGLAYIAARMSGKVIGCTVGAVVSNAEPVVRKYLGFALFDQAGVAIGLALAVHQEFSHLGAAGKELGELVLNVIMATTFIVQLIGPPFVKFAVTRAGEAGSAKAPA